MKRELDQSLHHSVTNKHKNERMVVREVKMNKPIKNSQNFSLQRQIKYKNASKDLSKTSEYDSAPPQISKKPRVPKTKRPKNRIETKEYVDPLTLYKQKSSTRKS